MSFSNVSIRYLLMRQHYRNILSFLYKQIKGFQIHHKNSESSSVDSYIVWSVILDYLKSQIHPLLNNKLFVFQN